MAFIVGPTLGGFLFAGLKGLPSVLWTAGLASLIAGLLCAVVLVATAAWSTASRAAFW